MENLWLTTLALTLTKKDICKNVMPCEKISKHDAPFVKQKFQTRYKFVCDGKSFNLENYVNDFSRLPLSKCIVLTTQTIKLKLKYKTLIKKVKWAWFVFVIYSSN